MKKRVMAIIVVAAMLIMSGCGSKMSDALMATEEAPVAEEPDVEELYTEEVEAEEESVAVGESDTSGAGTLITENTPVDNRKLIKNLDVDMQTMDFDKTIFSITALVNELGGYIEQSTISGNSLDYAGKHTDNAYNPRNASYILRIPVTSLDTAADELISLGNITRRSESVEDVTANYTDIESRIKTLRVQEERLLEILKAADELKYIITLEKELADVCYEIENYTANLNGLDNKTRYSFINIHVSEVIEYDDVYVAPPTFGTRIASGFSESMQAIADFGQSLVVILVTISPFLVIWGGILALLIVGILKGLKSYRKKHPKGLNAQKESESISEVKQEKTDSKV